MSSHHTLRNGLVVAALIALLTVASSPVHAKPVRPSVEKLDHVTGFGERLWHFLVSLWLGDLRKEGTSIDPNGDRIHEGVTIDPNGRS